MPRYSTVNNKCDLYIEGNSLELGNVDGNYVFASFRGWSNKAYLKRLQIIADTNGVSGPIDWKIIKNPGAYRAATPPDDELEVLVATNNDTGVGSPSPTWKVDEIFYDDGFYYEDGTLGNCFHLYLEAEAGVSDATTFTIRAWGQSIEDYDNYFNHDHNPDTWKAFWRNDVSAETWTNFGGECRNHLYARTANAEFYLVTEASGDQYFYIGAWRTFNKMFFDVATANSTQTDLTVEYLKNDATWGTLTVQDNTDAVSSGDSYPFSHPGVISFSPPSDWATRGNPITTGTPLDDTPRKWIRIGIDDISTPPTFYAVRILPLINAIS